MRHAESPRRQRRLHPYLWFVPLPVRTVIEPPQLPPRALSVRGGTQEALTLLAQSPWRGNVRELEAVLEQAMILRSGDSITPEDLDLPIADAPEWAIGVKRGTRLPETPALGAAGGRTLPRC